MKFLGVPSVKRTLKSTANQAPMELHPHSDSETSAEELDEYEKLLKDLLEQKFRNRPRRRTRPGHRQEQRHMHPYDTETSAEEFDAAEFPGFFSGTLVAVPTPSKYELLLKEAHEYLDAEIKKRAGKQKRRRSPSRSDLNGVVREPGLGNLDLENGGFGNVEQLPNEAVQEGRNRKRDITPDLDDETPASGYAPPSKMPKLSE